MTTVLHKGTSGIARNAKLALIVPEASDVAPPPDDRDIAIARLTGERDELRQKLQALEESWQQRLNALQGETRKIAEQEFIRDDQQRIEALDRAIEAGLELFEAELVNSAKGLAQRLAKQALSRLVRVRQEEADWLLRVIERRLEALRSQAILEIALSDDNVSNETLVTVSERFRSRANVTIDPTLKSGTARLGLRMGAIQIDPEHGLEQLLALLDGDA